VSYGGIALGARGERLATAYLRGQGYQVVARNWRCDIGEIDLIAARGSLLVIAEVKTRASTRFGVPAEAVGFAKQRKLRRLAAAWLAQSPARYDEVRFDVVSVIGNDVEVIPAAFQRVAASTTCASGAGPPGCRAARRRSGPRRRRSP